MKDKILKEGGVARDLDGFDDPSTVGTEGGGDDDFPALGQTDNVAFARKLSYASVTSEASRTGLQYVRSISIA